MAERLQRVRMAADVGGTFTDMVLEDGGRRWTTKVLTTPAAPEQGVLTGIEAILGLADKGIGDVDAFVHGTTLATNAVIERKGARTALVTTEGFRDVLEIASESRYDQYELALERPKPLVPRPLRYTLAERIDARGNVLLAPNEDDTRRLIDALLAADVDSVAVSFIHCYVNPAHEKVVGELFARHAPDIHLTLSHEVCPEIREYERTSTAVANAYVQPLMDGYLARMENQLRDQGFRGSLSMITAGGGLTSLDLARRFPIRLIESGPAGGAIFASHTAARLDEPSVISFDMGGTTAKISLIEEFQCQTARIFEVDRAARFMKGSGLPVRIPVIEMVEIGAGGGSIAKLDALQRITIGPESAASVPGPACYGRGGTEPAVTDADVALGLIDSDAFAGGRIKLAPELSGAALGRVIGTPLGLDASGAAHAVYEMVCENMASAARMYCVEHGAAANQYTMIAFGGAAPLHVARVAEKIGAPKVIVPVNAGVGSAVGFLAAPVSFEVIRSHYARLGEDFRPQEATAMLEAASREITAWVQQRSDDAPLVERRVAYMRYIGQGHEIAVDLPVRPLGHDDSEMLRQRYEEAYHHLFKRTIPNSPIEIMAWAISVSTVVNLPEVLAPIAVAPGTLAPARMASVYDGARGCRIDVPCYRRQDMTPGVRLAGPAIITEDETSTYVTATFDTWIDGTGAVVMERKDRK